MKKLLLTFALGPSFYALQAQSDSIEATADRDFMITANKGKVVIAAKEEILLTSGGAFISPVSYWARIAFG